MSTFDPEEGDLLGYYSKTLKVNKFCILYDVSVVLRMYGNWSTFPRCLLHVKPSAWTKREHLHIVIPKNYL